MKIVHRSLINFLMVFVLFQVQVVGTIDELSFSIGGKSAFAQSSKTVASVKTSDKGKNSSPVISLLTMLVIGLVSAGMVASCLKMTLDMYMVATGGLVFLMGEIFAIKGFKDLKKETLSAYVDANHEISSSQYEALATQKKLYLNVKKLAEKKLMFQKAAFTVFVGAAATAGYMGIKLKMGKGACSAEASSLAVFSQQCVAVPVAIVGEEVSSNTPGPSIAKEAQSKSTEAVISACPSSQCLKYIAEKKMYSGVCSPKQASKDMNSLNFYAEVLPVKEYQTKMSEDQKLSLFEKVFSNKLAKSNSLISSALNFIFPKAHANFLGMMGIGGSLLLVILGMRDATWLQWDYMVSSPLLRAATWTGTSLLVQVAMKTTKTVIKTAESNIEKIDKIIKRMDRINRGIVNGGAGVASAIPYSNLTGNQKLVPITLDTATPCIANGSTTSKCGSIKSAVASTPNLSQFGSGIGTIAGLTGAVGDGIQGTSNISSGTLGNTSALGARSAIAKRLLSKVAKKIDEQRKKDGLKPFNLENQGRKIANLLKRRVGNKVREGNTSSGAILASLGSIPASFEEDVKKEVNGLAAEAKPLLAEPAKRVSTNSSDFSFSLDDEQTLGNFEEEKAAINSNDKTGMDDVATEDIVSNSGVSIFKVISVRYIKSAFPTIFKKKIKE